MAKRVVVYCAGPDAESVGNVAARLRDGSVEIVDQQPHMLLVNGPERTVRRALGDARGWQVGPLTTVPPPSPRHKILKPPS